VLLPSDGLRKKAEPEDFCGTYHSDRSRGGSGGLALFDSDFGIPLVWNAALKANDAGRLAAFVTDDVVFGRQSTSHLPSLDRVLFLPGQPLPQHRLRLSLLYRSVNKLTGQSHKSAQFSGF